MEKGILQEKHGETLVPSGTVTFLFTDIEESTRLLERLLEKYALVLFGQRRILRAAFARWNGHEIDTQGDSFFVAFPRAIDAINCAIEAQRELALEPWPEGATVRVRMGLHTGEPITIGDGGYIGMDVHRAARIAASGHGGQVLLSQATRELIYHELPKGVSLSDLGSYKLKGIRFPEQIFQLNIDGMTTDFPELKTLSAEEEPPTPGESPYKGLQYFEEQDADLFFGREAVTARLVEMVQQDSFLAVIGASGSGKSSVVRAGLVPALKRSQAEDWQIYIFTPTAHPLESLAVNLTSRFASAASAMVLIDDMQRDPRSLHLWVRQNLAQAPKKSWILLVIDQFEELFTMCHDEKEQVAFVDNLLYAAEVEGSSTSIVLTLRADFYEHLAKFAGLRQLAARRQEYIGVVSAEELRMVIEEPARRGGWEFSAGLVDLMLYDVGAGEGRQPEPGALPLLSHALLETWKRRRGHLMSLQGYSEAGGVRGAIARTAERIFYGELSPEQRLIARNIFLRLTELGEGTQDTRRRADLKELTPADSQAEPQRILDVINQLADARLITVSDAGVEVAHEALIREWPALREWLAEDREGLLIHRRLTEAALEWQRVERDPGLLFRGSRLVQSLEWYQANPGRMNLLEQEFLDASNYAIEQEQIEREAVRQRELQAAEKLAETERQRAEEQAQTARRLRQRAVYLSIALLIAAVLAVAAIVFAQQSRQTSRLALSRELAAASLTNLTIDPERSILLALQAESTFQTKEAQNALHRAVMASRHIKTLPAHEGNIWAMTYSPDGTRLVTGGADKSVQIWDATTHEKIQTIPAHDADVESLAYSPDGKWLATSSDDGTVKIWDTSTWQLKHTLTGHTDWVPAVAYHPDGKQLATLGLDGTIKTWDAMSGAELATRDGYEFTGPYLTYSPDGSRLYFIDSEELRAVDSVSGQEIYSTPADSGVFALSPASDRLASLSEGLIRVMDAENGQALYNITGPTNAVQQLMFSSDGAALGAAGLDRKIYYWDAETGILLYTLAGHTGGISRVAFKPDGGQIASGDFDGDVKLWTLEPSREVLTIEDDPISRLAQSPDGMRLATAAGGVRIWDAHNGQLLNDIQAHEGRSIRARFSPDGRQIASGGRDQMVNVWDSASGEAIKTIPVEDQVIWGLAYRPDGKALAAVGRSGVVQIFDPADGSPKLSWDAGLGVLFDIAYSPDGRLLSVVSADSNDVKIFDADSGEELHVLVGHTGASGASAGNLTVAFSPDGKRLVTGGRDATARIWDTATGQLLLTLSGHTSTVTSARFSPDGKLVATNSRDGTARVWDSTTGEELLVLEMDYGGSGVEFTPDGQRLVIDDDNRIKVIALTLDELLQIAGERVTRTLTTEECQQYLHLDTCPTVSR